MKKFLFFLSFALVLNASNAFSVVASVCQAPNFSTASCSTAMYLFAVDKAEKNLINSISEYDDPMDNWKYGDKASTTINADFNGDGVTDPAYVKLDGNNIKWYSKVFNKAISFGTRSTKVLTGCDFNGDGATDLAYYDGAKKIVYYRTASSSTKRKIKLKLKNYNYLLCDDVLGTGATQIIAKKKQSKKVKGKTKYYWTTNVIDASSNVRKNYKFGSASQGSIIVQDVDGDGIKDVGYVVKASKKKTNLVFKSSSRGTKITQSISKLVATTNGVFDITPAKLANTTGYYFKSGSDFYFVDIVNNSYTEFKNVVRQDFSGISASKINLVKASDSFALSSGSNTKLCDVMRAKGNGFLWKGVGEAYGHVSVGILPIYNKATTCQVTATDGSTNVGMWCSSQSANPWKGVGRQHWRAKATCKSFKTPSYFRCKISGKWHCWTISSPCARIE